MESLKRPMSDGNQKMPKPFNPRSIEARFYIKANNNTPKELKSKRGQVWRKKTKSRKMEKNHFHNDDLYPTLADGFYDQSRLEIADLPSDNPSGLWSRSNDHEEDDDNYDDFDTDFDGEVLDLRTIPIDRKQPLDADDEDDGDDDGDDDDVETYRHEWVELQPGNREPFYKDKFYSENWVLDCKPDTKSVDLMCKICGTQIRKNYVNSKLISKKNASLETLYSPDDQLNEALSKLQMD